MNNLAREIFDWSDAWALLIPIAVLFRHKKQPVYLRPVKYYIWIALLLNVSANIIWKQQVKWNFPHWLTTNNYLYNIHSIVRLLLFSWFFILLNQRFMHRVKAVLPVLFIVMVVINFRFYENFFNYMILSSRLLATEAAILLFYCLQYYIFLLIDDKNIVLKARSGFWVVTGLSFFVAASFFIFLFYGYIAKLDPIFAEKIWDVHNFTYIILCICIAVNFYKANG